MKIAKNKSGKMIEAAANAPQKAICPHCNGVVILRSRRRTKKPGDVTYFWRHQDHSNTKCPARFKQHMAS